MKTTSRAIITATATLLGLVAIRVVAQPYSPDLPDYVPTDAVIQTVNPLPPSVPGATTPVPAALTTTNSFFALAYDEAQGVVPPDTQGAVGPSNVVTMLNTSVRIQDRFGRTNSTVALSNWWGTPVGFTLTDPRVIYEPYNNRWIASVLTHPDVTKAPTSMVLIAVSQTSDPTGTWNKFKIDVDETHSNRLRADFDMLGFNKNWVVLTANILPNNNPIPNERCRLWVFNKTNLFSATNVANLSYTMLRLTNQTSFLAPSLMYDNTAINMYLLTVWKPDAGLLQAYSITGAVNSPKLITNAMPTITNLLSGWVDALSIDAFGTQTNAELPPLETRIALHNSRFHAPIIYRNGSLWCTHMIYLVPFAITRAAVQWWQISAPGFKPLQVGRIGDVETDNERRYGYPSIAVNRFNDVLIGYSHFADNEYASAHYAFRPCDAAIGVSGCDTLLKSGEGPYVFIDTSALNRWGDYSATVVDPLDDIGFWTIQEYARPYTGTLVNGSGRWGTWWGQLSPPMPSNDNFANALTLSNANYGTLIRATKETGEPNHASSASAASVWYNWTAPSNAAVRLEVQALSNCGGTAFDTIIAVYRGTNVSALTLVTNKHAVNGATLVFNATSGTTYRVAVAGYNGSSGDYYLAMNQTTAPMITLQPHSWDVYEGSNITFNVESSGDPPLRFQWRWHNPTNINSTTNITAATNADFTLCAQTSDIANYSVVVTNSFGSVTSSLAHLYVYVTQAASLAYPTFLTNTFQFEVSGITGAWYVVGVSTDLVHWVENYTNRTTFTNIDTAITNYPYRFYRARYQP